MKKLTKLISCIVLFSFIFLSSNAQSADRRGRLGVGMTNQLLNDLPAISFKLQRSKSFAFGGVLGYSNEDAGGGHGAGLKVYRIMFDEPQLNFYAAGLAALVKKSTSASTEVEGFQVDLTLGSEFSFAGLASLGFSFEFGVSLNKLTDFVVETTGSHFVVSGIHFYL